MERFKLEDGMLIPDENGDYMYVTQHKEITSTLKAQIDAVDTYIDSLQSYINSIIE